MSTTSNDSSSRRPAHKWNFFRAGGFEQVHFESGADLVNLDQLDQKLWAALSCPTRGIERLGVAHEGAGRGAVVPGARWGSGGGAAPGANGAGPRGGVAGPEDDLAGMP